MKGLLPITCVVAVLLIVNINANAQNEVSKEEIEDMLYDFLNGVDLPVPSNFRGDYEWKGEPYIFDYSPPQWVEMKATLSITKQVNDRVRVNGTYLYHDEILPTYYTYWQRAQAYIQIYIDSLDPSIGCRHKFEYDVNDLKNKYDVREESNNRLVLYSVEIGDWEDEYYWAIERDYEIYSLQYFSIGDYEVYVKVNVKVDMDTDSIKKETEYVTNLVYDIDPKSLIINDVESINLYSSFADDLTNNLKTKLQELLGQEEGGKEEKEREEEKYTVGNITVYFEYYFDITDGKPMITYWWNPIIECGSKKYYPYYNMSVEHLATGIKNYISDFDSGKISMDKVFNVSLINLTGDGRFRITLDIFTDDLDYINRVKDESFLPNKAIIECNVETNGNKISSVEITKARHCWIKVGDEWEILWSKKGYKQKDGTNGFEIKVRSILAWEKRIKYSIYKFLEESNFYSSVEDAYTFDLATIDSIPIYYERGATPGYNPSLNTINMSGAAGNIYTYNSDEFDSLFHEFAHALKERAYHFDDEDVDAYLGGTHGATCSVSNIYFAFEEAHSEFFASLMVDYVKEKGLIEEQYMAETNYYNEACHYDKEGDKVEGAIAGLLLNGLYLDYAKYEYKNAQTKTYELFAKACELCHKYLKHYPYSIHDLLPFLFAVEPKCQPEIAYRDMGIGFEGAYNCKSYLHTNGFKGKTNGLYGYPLLIAVEPSWFTRVDAYVNDLVYTIEEPSYGAMDVSDGEACLIFIDEKTRIEADFDGNDGVYMVLFDMDGNPMEEILAMHHWLGNAIIEFEKDGIKIVQGDVVVKSHAGTTYRAGEKIEITPHSEFVLNVENDSALLYVLNGSVGITNGVEYEELGKNEKAEATEEGIHSSNYKSKELEDMWDNFGNAMETLGIEKEEKERVKQPGFGLFILAFAIVIVAIRKRRHKMQR